MKRQHKIFLTVAVLFTIFAKSAPAENGSNYRNNEILSNKTEEVFEVTEKGVVIDGRKYNFFGEDIFDCDFFKSIVDEKNIQHLMEKPILRDYFILIYPATVWLENESLHIFEIL